MSKTSNNHRPLAERAREKISAGMVLTRLAKHVKGELEMSNTQIAAARILLAKVLPDLTSVEHSGEVVSKHVTEMSREELLSIAAGGRTGSSKAGSSEREPTTVH